MKIVTHVLQVLISIVFVMAGVMKLTTPYSELIADKNMAWTNDFSSTEVVLIGIFETLLAVLLILGLFVKKLKNFSPIIGALFSIQMVVAMSIHLGRNEMENVYINITLVLITLTFAILKFNLNSKSRS